MAPTADPHARRRPVVRLAVLTGTIGLVLGGALGWTLSSNEEDEPPTTTASTSTSTTAATTTITRTGDTDPIAVAEAIGSIPRPSDCPLALDEPDLLPNAPRDYRGGVHEGVDFICGELGHDAVTPLAGRVLVTTGDLAPPTPEEREELLADAKALGDTPPWTLQLLYGRFVVVDHGQIDGAGHVVTLYAHLDETDPDLRPGLEIPAGTRIGAIGNSGTEAAGTGSEAPYSYQLHWEIQVDDEFLGQGASPDDVVTAYQTLFPDP